VKERELGIPDSRGVGKLFALLPFAEIKRFLPWQGVENGWRWIEDERKRGRDSRDALTGFDLSPSFVVFRENMARARRIVKES